MDFQKVDSDIFSTKHQFKNDNMLNDQEILSETKAEINSLDDETNLLDRHLDQNLHKIIKQKISEARSKIMDKRKDSKCGNEKKSLKLQNLSNSNQNSPGKMFAKSSSSGLLLSNQQYTQFLSPRNTSSLNKLNFNFPNNNHQIQTDRSHFAGSNHIQQQHSNNPNNESMISLFNIFPEFQQEFEKNEQRQQLQTIQSLNEYQQEASEQQYNIEKKNCQTSAFNKFKQRDNQLKRKPQSFVQNYSGMNTQRMSEVIVTSTPLVNAQKINKYEQFREKVRKQIFNPSSSSYASIQNPSQQQLKQEKTLIDQLDIFMKNQREQLPDNIGDNDQIFCTFNSPSEFNRLSAPIMTSLSKQKIEQLQQQFTSLNQQQQQQFYQQQQQQQQISPTPRFQQNSGKDKKDIINKSKQKFQTKIKQTLLNQDLSNNVCYEFEEKQQMKPQKKTTREFYGSMLNEYFPVKTSFNQNTNESKKTTSKDQVNRRKSGGNNKSFGDRTNKKKNKSFNKNSQQELDPQEVQTVKLVNRDQVPQYNVKATVSGCSLKECHLFRQQEKQQTQLKNDSKNAQFLTIKGNEVSNHYQSMKSDQVKSFVEQGILSERTNQSKNLNEEQSLKNFGSDYKSGKVCLSPTSQNGGDKLRMSLLQKTSSIDHYLSNGTTFLKGQRFTGESVHNPIDKQQQRINLRNYFLNLLNKKILQYVQKEKQFFFECLKERNQAIMQKKQEKLWLLVNTHNLNKQRMSFKIWHQYLITSKYRRKGYAVESLLFLLSHYQERETFQILKEFNNRLREKECMLAETVKQNILRLSWNCMQQKCMLSKLKYQRDRFFGRCLMNCYSKFNKRTYFKKLKQLQKFKNLKLRVSLNLKIREIIMASFSTDFTKRQTRDKLFKIIGLQKLDCIMQTVKQKNLKESISKIADIYRIKQTQRLRLLELNSQQEQEKRKQMLKKYQQTLQGYTKLASKQLASLLTSICKEKKKETFKLLLENNIKQKGIFKIKSFLSQQEIKHRLQKCFQQWKQQKQNQNEFSLKKQVLEFILLGKQRGEVKKRFKIWQRMNREQEIKEQILQRILQFNKGYQQRFKLTKSKAFKQWKKSLNSIRKLQKVVFQIEKTKKRKAFLNFKSRIILQKQSLYSQFAQLVQQTVKRIMQREKQQAFIRLYKNKVYPKEAQLIKSQGLIIATCIFKKIKKREDFLTKKAFIQWRNVSDQLGGKLVFRQFNKYENLINIIKEFQQQRLHCFLSKLRQLYFLRKHQCQMLLKLLTKKSKKLKFQGFQLFQKQLTKFEKQRINQHNKKVLSIQRIDFILQKYEKNLVHKSYLQWIKESQYYDTSIKVSNAIKEIIATTKIVKVYNECGIVKQSFRKWQKFNYNYQNITVGLQILLNIQKRVKKQNFIDLKEKGKLFSNQRKEQIIKGQVIAQLLQHQTYKRLDNVFNKLVATSLFQKVENEKQNMKQKKIEIHNQIVYLSEKDQKLRSQEAQLSMKESRLQEKEKELKEKQKRLKDASKQEKERKMSVSKSPSRYAINIPQISTNKIATTNKFQTSKLNNNAQQKVVIKNEQNLDVKPSSTKQAIRMDVISSLQQDFEKVNQRVNQVSFPFKSIKDQKSPTVIYSTQSFSSQGVSQNNLNKENNTTSSFSQNNDKSQNLKKSSYLSSQNNNNNNSSSVVSSSGLLSNRSNAGTNKYEAMKIKLLKSAFEKLSEIISQEQFKKKEFVFQKLKFNLMRKSKIEGARRINDYICRKVLSQCLINWLKSVYEEEILMQESLDNRRLHKLYKAVQIVEKSKRKEEVLVLRYFKEWKRMGFQIILQGLRQYSETINVSKSRIIPMKKGSGAVTSRLYNNIN